MIYFRIILISLMLCSQPTLSLAGEAVSPSQAAEIAKEALPGATVVGVKLLPNGAYAVTLRMNNAVERILVDAENGSLR